MGDAEVSGLFIAIPAPFKELNQEQQRVAHPLAPVEVAGAEPWQRRRLVETGHATGLTRATEIVDTAADVHKVI